MAARTPGDPEVKAIQSIARALEDLELRARRRVIDFFDKQLVDEEERAGVVGERGERA